MQRAQPRRQCEHWDHSRPDHREGHEVYTHREVDESYAGASTSTRNRRFLASGCAEKWKVQGILLPGSPGGRWNPLLLPGGVQPRFRPSNLLPLGHQLRGNRKSLIIVGTCVNEPLRWSHTDRQPGLYCTRRSCFAPISSGGFSRKSHFSAQKTDRRWWWRRRGTAPRVRNAYSTQYSTDIAGYPACQR